jgi:hypothetical protein
MAEKLELLEEKIRHVVLKLETLKDDNTALRSQNAELKSQLGQVRQELEALKREHRDQTDAVRSKLTLVLSRVDELEKISL